MKPQSLEEYILWYSLLFIFPFYFIGSLYIVYPIVCWIFILLTLYRLLEKKADLKFFHYLWLSAGIIFLIGTIIAQAYNDTPLTKIITNIIFDFGKSMGIFFFIPIAGTLKIRSKLIERALCILCIQSLCWLPIFLLGFSLNIPGYMSPLSIIGRGSPGNYFVSFGRLATDYDPTPRFALFAPWAPGLGCTFSLFFFIVWRETNKYLRYISMIACYLFVILSVSRLGLVTVPFTFSLLLTIQHLSSHYKSRIFQLASVIFIALFGISFSTVYTWVRDTKDYLDKARSSSTLVREKLVNIAIERWKENPLFGHGAVEPGPLIVAKMPIGSHHTWAGLLFTNGLVGLFSLLLPYLLSIGFFIVKYFKTKSSLSLSCLGVLIQLGLYSVGETWGSLSYLIWPALIYFGIGLKL